MKNQVKVVLQPDKTDLINLFPLSSDGVQRGSIMVESSEIHINNGFATESKRVAFINGDINVLGKLGLKVGSLLEGKIIVAESTTPYFEGQQPKINPSTKAVINHGGLPVYRKSTFVTDLNAVDVLLTSDPAVAVIGRPIPTNSAVQ